MTYRTVIVGTDGSDTSLRAVAAAARFAVAFSADLRIVCAYHPMTAREQAVITTGLGDTKYRVTGTEATAEALEAARRTALDAGAASVATEAVQGDAVEALLEASAADGPTLLVIGNRGMNRLSRRLLGSVPADIAHRATCDVVIAHTTG